MLEQIAAFSIGGISAAVILETVILAVICIIAIRVAQGILGKALSKTKMDKGLQGFLLSIAKAVLYFLAVLLVADSLGVQITSLVALFSVFGLAVSLAVQGVLTNLANGVILLTTHPFREGDYIEAGQSAGTVRSVGLIYTALETADGKRVFLPNSTVAGSSMTNHTATGRRRAEVKVGVDYACPTAAVKAALATAAAKTQGIYASPAPTVTMTMFGDSAIEYTLRAWVPAADFFALEGALRENVRTALDDGGLSISYNRLDVHLLHDHDPEPDENK